MVNDILYNIFVQYSCIDRVLRSEPVPPCSYTTYGNYGPGKNGPGKNGLAKTVQVITVLGKNGPGKKGPAYNQPTNEQFCCLLKILESN